MKEYWRVKCGDPDDTFFIMCDPAVSMDAAIQTLRHVQIGESTPISEAEVGLYDRAHVSLFNVSPRKRPIDHDEKRRRMESLRNRLCAVVTHPPPSIGLADELEMRTNSEVINTC
eukprot:6911306-Prymnesium_polylepis.1